MIPPKTVVLYNGEDLIGRMAERKRNEGILLGALAESTILHHENWLLNHTSRTVQSGATGDFQSVRILQAQNASLQRQLGHVSGRFLSNSYTRNDRLYNHIVHEQERHQRVAAKIRESRCLACGQNGDREA